MPSSSVIPQASHERTRSAMMAWRVHEFGPPEVMSFERVPRPELGPGEVLVKVEAVGVGSWDGWIRAGKSALPQPLPLTLGSHLSGEVARLGLGVSDLRVGDRVYGITNSQFIGAYTEYALAAAGMVSHKPASLTHVEAASLPVMPSPHGRLCLIRLSPRKDRMWLSTERQGTSAPMRLTWPDVRVSKSSQLPRLMIFHWCATSAQIS
jgi:hypothetical protein